MEDSMQEAESWKMITLCLAHMRKRRVFQIKEHMKVREDIGPRQT
jgi:hypothetical protein